LPDVAESLSKIKRLISAGEYLATEYADNRWVGEHHHTWDEFVEAISRLTPECCLGIRETVSEHHKGELVHTYILRLGMFKKGREKAYWFEVVLCDTYVKVISAHHTTLAKEDAL